MDTKEELFRAEMRNAEMIPFNEMSKLAKKFMLEHNQLVEWWSPDGPKWSKPRSPKEKWNGDIYRIPDAPEGCISIYDEYPELQPVERQDASRLDLEQARRVAQVCFDMHGALGVKWGNDPYEVISKLMGQDNSLVYLATPFYHQSYDIMELRFKIVSRVAAEFMIKGVHVFSPISHCYPMAREADLPRGWDYWQHYDRKMIRMCSRMIVLMLDGWKESSGIKHETELAKEMGIPIEYIYPGDVVEALKTCSLVTEVNTHV